MKVCDVCWSPEKVVEASAKYIDDSGFWKILWRQAETDLCPECIKLLQAKDFQKLGNRAHDALLTRAGLQHLQEAPSASKPPE